MGTSHFGKYKEKVSLAIDKWKLRSRRSKVVAPALLLTKPFSCNLRELTISAQQQLFLTEANRAQDEKTTTIKR